MKALLLAVPLIATGCSSLMSHDIGGGGRILISADEAGMRAFGDYSRGLTDSATEAKGEYWHLRRAHEVTKRMQYAVTKPGEQK